MLVEEFDDAGVHARMEGWPVESLAIVAQRRWSQDAARHQE